MTTFAQQLRALAKEYDRLSDCTVDGSIAGHTRSARYGGMAQAARMIATMWENEMLAVAGGKDGT